MLRLTPDAFNDLRSRIDGAMAKRGAVQKETKKQRNLYGNVHTTVQGQKFDSKSEARRFIELQAMQQAGEITDLKTQVAFDLIPAQNTPDRKERPVKYIADFSYWKDGVFVVEDVKSAPTKTKEFIIKRKLLLWLHGIAVREVLMS